MKQIWKKFFKLNLVEMRFINYIALFTKALENPTRNIKKNIMNSQNLSERLIQDLL
jgi:hypothetical protein